MFWAAVPLACGTAEWREPVGQWSVGVPWASRPCSITPCSTPLHSGLLLGTPRALWHRQCKNEESNWQVRKLYWPLHQQYSWLALAITQLRIQSELSRLSGPRLSPPALFLTSFLSSPFLLPGEESLLA